MTIPPTAAAPRATSCALAWTRLLLISEKFADELTDTGLNMGPNRRGEFLQRLLNAFNGPRLAVRESFVDSAVGPVSLNPLRKFLRWRRRGRAHAGRLSQQPTGGAVPRDRRA